jgi:hypothetical protein
MHFLSSSFGVWGNKNRNNTIAVATVSFSLKLVFHDLMSSCRGQGKDARLGEIGNKEPSFEVQNFSFL